MRFNDPSPPARGGRGQGEGGGADAQHLPASHLTLPRRSLSLGRAPRGPVGRKPLPLPRCGTEKGLIAAAVVAILVSAAPASSAPPIEAEHGMVVSAHRLASEIGVQILQAGGNAVDAAVAVGYALAVVDPCCGNIGGGGFMTIHLADGRETFVNFREIAPKAVTAAMYLDAQGRLIDDLSRHGYRAAAVPGTVMGLDSALGKYGRLTRATVIAPAVALARDGFVLNRADTDILDARADRLAKDPAAAKIFLRPDGSHFEPGDRLVQSELAATLGLISDQGPEAFYRGPVAAAVGKASAENGGILTAADFAAYTVTESAPLTCSYRGYRVVSSPPPSSGGVTICEILNILEGYDIASSGFRSTSSVHLLIEAMRRGYRDRNADLGDPAFVANPLERLLSKEYAASLRAEIDRGVPERGAAVGAASEKAETTHYSVVDGEGNAVAVTYTINGYFGAGVVAPGTGFFLNNEMDDFTVKPDAPNLFGLVQGEPNTIAPGKRPLSSMAPTLVERDGKVVLVLGSPGGSRIITTVLETIMNIVDNGMSAQEAVDAPRLHHQSRPKVVYFERSGLLPEVVGQLTEMGYRLVEQRPWGAVELVEIADHRLRGVSDHRLPAGAAVGY
ncbi:MAG: gamma-glutamyltransferase [Alphaproteobacteria bacterium]|nr:gamma-glutamyltransferase [Alphaproteobacteria bacterium]